MKQKVIIKTVLVTIIILVIGLVGYNDIINQSIQKSNATKIEAKSHMTIEQLTNEINSQSDYDINIYGYDKESNLLKYTISDNDEVKYYGSVSQEYLEEMIYSHSINQWQ